MWAGKDVGRELVGGHAPGLEEGKGLRPAGGRGGEGGGFGGGGRGGRGTHDEAGEADGDGRGVALGIGLWVGEPGVTGYECELVGVLALGGSGPGDLLLGAGGEEKEQGEQGQTGHESLSSQRKLGLNPARHISEASGDASPLLPRGLPEPKVRNSHAPKGGFMPVWRNAR